MLWILKRPWREIFGGLLIIAVGLIRAESVFLGDFGVLPLVFDAMGVCFVVYGLVQAIRAWARPPAA